MKTKIFKALFLSAIVLLAVRAEAQTCSFTRDLYEGSRGEDVRCLQEYLRSSQYGYTYGYSDGVFGPMTRQALAQWQAGQGITASGFFDAISRARYSELMGNYNIPTPGVVGGYPGNYSYNSYVATPGAQRAQDKMWEALRMIGNAWDEIENTNRNTSSAKKDLKDAQDDLRDAAQEFFANGDYNDAYELAVDAFENAEDAFDKVDGGGSGTRADADDAIDDANDAIDDAEDEIDDARDRGVSSTIINRAKDFLSDAEDKLDDAEEQFDDKDYDDAEDLANDAEDLAQDAIDEVN